MSDKDNKKSSQVEKEKPIKKESAPETVAKKPVAKKPVAKKTSKSLKFQGKEVKIVSETKSRKGSDWDLIDLKFLDEDRVFRIKRKSLDK